MQRREGRVLVDGNLTSGDIVVIEGTQRMRDGAPVSYDLQRLVRDEQGDAMPMGADPVDVPTS